jgi:circadian clock protein KaiB
VKTKAKKRGAPKRGAAKRSTPKRRTRTAARAAKNAAPRYLLRLYITGQTPRSQRSVENLRALCDKHLAGRFDLEVVDIYQQPGLAAAVQIVAAPTLIKSIPLPLRRLVGDFSDQDRVILGLDIQAD